MSQDEIEKVYVAVNYGAYEGWLLERFDSVQEAIEHIMTGQTYGYEWKILREIKFVEKK
jgi:hypothetical protein